MSFRCRGGTEGGERCHWFPEILRMFVVPYLLPHAHSFQQGRPTSLAAGTDSPAAPAPKPRLWKQSFSCLIPWMSSVCWQWGATAQRWLCLQNLCVFAVGWPRELAGRTSTLASQRAALQTRAARPAGGGNVMSNFYLVVESFDLENV